MYSLKLYLYIVSFNMSLSEQCFVSTDGDKYMPLYIEINEKNSESIEEILRKIFEQYIDLGFGWITTKLIDAQKKDDILHLVYVCNIPPNTKLKNAYYISKNIAIIDRLARKALYYV